VDNRFQVASYRCKDKVSVDTIAVNIRWVYTFDALFIKSMVSSSGPLDANNSTCFGIAAIIIVFARFKQSLSTARLLPLKAFRRVPRMKSN
jgi:hypothetical protein